MKIGASRFLAFALAVAAWGATARTEAGPTTEPSAIMEAIDRDLGTLSLKSLSLAAVLEQLGEKAGVKFEIDEDVYGSLPWGRDTKLADVTLSGATLRTALDAIMRPLGLVYSVRERSIHIDAGGPLSRMNRRATWNDLKLLQMLDSTEYTSESFRKVKVQYHITSKVNAPQLLTNQMRRAGDGTLSQIMTIATNALGWTWYPDEDHVIVLSAQAHIAHNLARTITARYNQMALGHILLDLADKADTALFMEPGLMLNLPPETTQSYTLLLQETSVRAALELICAETGLNYEIRDDGLHIGLAPEAKRGAQPAARTRVDPYVARILVPTKNGGYSYEFLIRESELPADIREYRGQMLDEMIERIRQDMAPSETGQPSSAPTTQSEGPG